MPNQHRLSKMTLALTLLFCLAGLAPAQDQQPSGGSAKKKDPTKKTFYTFDDNDRIHGAIGPMKKTFFVGEPVVVPLIIANHTRYPITLVTGINPRANLKVMIRPEGEAQFRYSGPYPKGFYGPSPIYMYPYDELHYDYVIWSDFDITGRLALAKPGIYTIDISLMLGVDESRMPTQELKLDGGTFSITVEPTPKPLAPLVDLLKQGDNLLYLHLHRTPFAWGPKTADILNQYPQTIFTPYLCYGLGNYYAMTYDQKPTREAADAALKFYTFAAKSDSPFREEVYLDLLGFMDKLGMTRPAAATAAEFLAKIPENSRGKIGNLELLQKYLVNTLELDPIKYWAFLP